MRSSRGTTTATTRWPHSGSGTPTTATSADGGAGRRAPAPTAAGHTFSPPVTMTSPAGRTPAADRVPRPTRRRRRWGTTRRRPAGRCRPGRRAAASGTAAGSRRRRRRPRRRRGARRRRRRRCRSRSCRRWSRRWGAGRPAWRSRPARPCGTGPGRRRRAVGTSDTRVHAGAGGRPSTAAASKPSWTVSGVPVTSARVTTDSPPTWASGRQASHRSAAGSTPRRRLVAMATRRRRRG